MPNATGPRAYEAEPGGPPGYSPAVLRKALVAVEEAATEAREGRERGERDDKAEQIALADHAANPFGEGYACEPAAGVQCSLICRSSGYALSSPDWGSRMRDV